MEEPVNPSEQPFPNVSEIQPFGPDSRYVKVGDQVFDRAQFVEAFGLHGGGPGDEWRSHHHSYYRERKIVGPAAVGFAGCGISLFLLSLVLAHARHATDFSIIIGMAFFVGGVLEIFAGIGEFIIQREIHEAVILSALGGFWMGFAAISVPSFGIIAAYGDNVSELDNVIGFYFISWFVLVFALTLLTFKSTVSYIVWFFTLDMLLLLVAIGYWTGNVGCLKAAGWFGFVSAFAAFYLAIVRIASAENSYIPFPSLTLPNGHAAPQTGKHD